MFPENSLFGHDHIIEQYCDLQEKKYIFGSFPHGWAIKLHSSKRLLSFAPLYLWNLRNLKQAIDLGISNVKCIGAPFAYLINMLWPNDHYPKGKGTIIYPELVDSNRDYRDLAHELVKEVRLNYNGPYTVSLRNSEFTSELIKFWEKFGWNVTTNGPRINKNFLVKQALEIVKHENAVGNEIQTALVYAAALKRNICVLGPTIYSGDNNPYDIQNWENYYNFCRNENVSIHKSNELGKFEIGYDQIKERKDLISELGFDSRRKQILGSSINYLYKFFTPEWFYN